MATNIAKANIIPEDWFGIKFFSSIIYDLGCPKRKKHEKEGWALIIGRDANDTQPGSLSYF